MVCFLGLRRGHGDGRAATEDVSRKPGSSRLLYPRRYGKRSSEFVSRIMQLDLEKIILAMSVTGISFDANAISRQRKEIRREKETFI